MFNITSKENQKIKDLIRIRDDIKFRNDKSLFYVEGKRLVYDTPIDLIDSLFINEKFLNNYNEIINKINKDNIYVLNDIVFNKIKDTVNSQGIIATVKKKILTSINNIDFNKINSILVLDNIQDPGNIGTILRIAEATGINLICISFDSCDIYNPKVIRSSMSSIFRLNIFISDDLISNIDYFKSLKYKIYSSCLSGNCKSILNTKFDKKSCFVVGNEGIGIKQPVISLSNELIKIPMYGNIESLNVATATTILCYEYMKQNYEI